MAEKELPENSATEVEEKDPPVIFILALLFLPAAISGWLIYGLFRFLRLKLSFVLCIVAVYELVLFVLWKTLGIGDKVSALISNPKSITTNWPDLVWLYVMATLPIGGIVGVAAIVWMQRSMKMNPYWVTTPGTWMHNFTYRRTPVEIFKRNKLIEKLKDGGLHDPEKAPLGLNEDGEYRLVYRYMSEAARHSIIIGGTGSGKTKTMLSLIRNDIIEGVPTVIIDMKRSPKFAARVATWAEENDAEFYHFVNGDKETYNIPGSPGQAYYDMLKSGTPTSKADMLLNMREYDSASAVYRSNMQQLLQVLNAMLHFADRDHPRLKEAGYQTVTDLKGNKLPVNERETFRSNETRRFTERRGVVEFCQEWVEANPQWVDEAWKKEIVLSQSKSRSRKLSDKSKAYLLDKVKQNWLDILIAAGVIEITTVNKVDWEHGGFYQIPSAIREGVIQDLAIACEGTPVENDAADLAERAIGKTSIAHALEELRGQMRTITASEYGVWLKTSDEGRNIDLYEQTLKKKVVILFSLNSDSEPEFARYMGSLIMSDLTATSAKRRNAQAKNQINVYIDEFQAINPSSVSSLLEKSRESKIGVTLAQQSFEQIVVASPSNGEAYLKSVLDNCSNFIIHAGSTQDSADRLAKIIGKHEVDRYRSSNKNQKHFFSVNWNNKRNQTIQTFKEEDWKFAPQKFMNLSSPDKNNGFKSTAVIINKTCADPEYKGTTGAVARTVWMIPSNDVLEEYDDYDFAESVPVKPKSIYEEDLSSWENDSVYNAESFGINLAKEDEYDDEEDHGDWTYSRVESEPEPEVIEDEEDMLTYSDVVPRRDSDVSTAAIMFSEIKNSAKPSRSIKISDKPVRSPSVRSEDTSTEVTPEVVDMDGALPDISDWD